MSEMNIANSDLTKHSQYLEQEQLLMKVENELILLYFSSYLFEFHFILIGTNWKIKK